MLTLHPAHLFRLPALFGLAILSGPLVSATPAAAPVSGDSRPNLVVVLADDLGYGNLGCYGNAVVRTPQLDRFAAEGLRLTDCYAAAANWSPARAGLMSGRIPYRAGIHNWIPMHSPMHLRLETAGHAQRSRAEARRRHPTRRTTGHRVSRTEVVRALQAPRRRGRGEGPGCHRMRQAERHDGKLTKLYGSGESNSSAEPENPEPPRVIRNRPVERRKLRALRILKNMRTSSNGAGSRCRSQ
jgi:Sulfatase